MSGLREQAEGFAATLTESVHAVAPKAEPFRATAISGTALERFTVRQEPDTGVVLTVEKQPLLSLKVEFRCTWDGAGHYLAVDASKIKVFAGTQASKEPLFRYEYVRADAKDFPNAHIQLHAHRDAMTHVMGRSGAGTRRARRRRDSDAVPQMSELHFPVGGPRFRPCLEDVLEMLVCELGVDCDTAGRKRLAAGRQHWRRQQTRTVVRDSPEDAAETLRLLGYDVTAPADGHLPMNVARLEQL